MKLFLRLSLLCTLCVAAGNAFALDREAFTFTNYDLHIRIEPGQQRLGVRGKLTLRNDSPSSQKTAVLQISSSLDWRSIRAAGKPVQFIAQSYTSDIDHTGALSEAVVALPEAIPPKSTIDIEIAYEGVIVLDATRLTRIDTPETAANSTDWDQIAPQFTAVRGAGYVTWYPIATESASLSDANLFDTLARWKARQAASAMHLQIAVSIDTDSEKPELLLNATTCPTAHEVQHDFVADCTYRSLGSIVPTLAIANYETVERAAITVHFLPGHDASAAKYADAAEKTLPLITEWFGPPRSKAQTADLSDPNAAPYESGPLLLASMPGTDPKLATLIAAHQLTHAAFASPRPWINEGLAHFAQALDLEHEKGRQPALDYMGLHRSAFASGDPKQEIAGSNEEKLNSLINTPDEQLYRSKAMFVWWMLRDMLGGPALKKALAAYHPEQDNQPSYMPQLIQAQTQKDLEWFFDDWVYRDRGLPEFKVASAFTRKLLPEGFMVTITIENSGAAGAEVPLTVKFGGGEVTKRLVVRGRSNATIRIQVAKPPEEIVVNDGSVPERNMANNVFKIAPVEAVK